MMRKLTPLDGDILREHFIALDDTSRRLRFCGPVNDRFLTSYCDRIDWLRTTIVGYFVDHVLRGVAELIVLKGYWPARAELAISVQPGFQSRGIGGHLVDHALAIARNRFIARVEIVCLMENHRMRRLAERHGAALKTRLGEVKGRFPASWPNYLTLMEEAAAEGAAMFQAVLDLPQALTPGFWKQAG